MNTAIAVPGNTASTLLSHFFGGGLVDDVAVDRILTNQWCPCRDGAPAKDKSRRKAKLVTASLKAVREIRLLAFKS